MSKAQKLLDIAEGTGSIKDIVKKHINTYSVADDPYEVAEEIGKQYNWSVKQIEAAEKIIRKNYIK